MSNNARIFAEGYRGAPLETEKRLGMTHLVPGQHEAIWSDDEHSAIELSYVHILGHQFIVLVLDPDSLELLRSATVGVFGIVERPPPPDFELSDKMLAAVTKLRTREAATP